MLNKKFKKTVVLIFSLIMLMSKGYAASQPEPVATIGQFSILKEDCKLDGYTCDYNLYQENVFQSTLVDAWDRDLNLEHATANFLHVSYGYTFNIHHDIFISKQGDVDTYDDLMAVDPKTGCIARLVDWTVPSRTVPSIVFEHIFENKRINKFELKPDDFEEISSGYMMLLNYFSEIEFDESGDLTYNFKMKSGEFKEVKIQHPCMPKP